MISDLAGSSMTDARDRRDRRSWVGRDAPARNYPDAKDRMPRIKVALVDLDGKPVPDWVPRQLGVEGVELAVHDCQHVEDLRKHAGDADVVWLFGGSRILMEGNLAAVPRCWAIVRTGSGTDNVPVDEATNRGIVVANTPAAFSDPASDHVIGLLFAAARQITALDRAVRAGQWNQTAVRPLVSVHGRTLGLVGFGHVASAVARKLSGFAMRVLVHDPYVAKDVLLSSGAQPSELDVLLRESDFVSVHCPLTRETTHLIGERELRLMKPTAVLLNTSRGAVIDERALVRALEERWIAGAGLDVVEDEPPRRESLLLRLDNVVLTPHLAGYSADGVDVRWRLSLETVIDLARRRWPPSCVNPNVQPARELSRS
jgi:D-3-phosphoglycerate dehydrogenase